MKKWNNLPIELQCNEIKTYYNSIKKKWFSRFLKRSFDLFVAFVFLLILILPIGLISLVVIIDSKGPAFYKQERVTIYNKPFRIYKFRTMVVDADKIGSLVTTKNDNRITRVGKFLRKTKLDELPQLFNIFNGTMSFVGTRPEVRKYVDYYKPEYMATLLLRPGITSLASIKFKDESNIIESTNGQNIDEVYVKNILPQKMSYNLEYAMKFNLIKDMGIMWNTFFSMFKK